MAKGWIALHRQLQDHWLWEDKPFSKGQAWIDLLMMANRCDRKFLLGNELIQVQAGDVVTSILKLKDRWGWSNSKVVNFLKLLESDGMIVKKSDAKKTVITIENYSKYSIAQNEKAMPERCESDAEAMPERCESEQTTIIDNYNNYNNEDKKPTKHKYGEYQNVLLTDEELEKLQNEYIDWADKIERLSSYVASTGKKYKSHYATIRNWARKDAEKQNKEQKGRLDWIDDL